MMRIVLLIEEDLNLVNKSTGASRRSSRSSKKVITSLPCAASQLVQMVNEARLKVENDKMSLGLRKRKTNQQKTVKDYMMKTTNHDSEFKEITKDDIEDSLLCPLCNRRSVICVTTREEVEETNKNIRIEYETKLAAWTAKGKVGSKPRTKKTESQVLGCVCYTQNCIGNIDGSGCFECKDESTTKQW